MNKFALTPALSPRRGSHLSLMWNISSVAKYAHNCPSFSLSSGERAGVHLYPNG